jgi:hypothetical protein
MRQTDLVRDGLSGRSRTNHAGQPSSADPPVLFVSDDDVVGGEIAPLRQRGGDSGNDTAASGAVMGSRHLHAHGNPLRSGVQGGSQGPERLSQDHRGPAMKQPVRLGIPGYRHSTDDPTGFRFDYLYTHPLHERSISGDP